MKTLRKLRIREIASVDRPAQIGASVVLLKRNEPHPTGEQTVTDKNVPTVESLAKQLADTQAELAVSKSMLELTAEQREFHKGLDEAGRTEFLKLSATDRQARIDVRKGENPVVFKSDEGVEFRKNDDPRMVEMAKRLDSESKLRKASDEKIARVAFEKRAGDELLKLPGTMDVKVALLKAVDSITDQPTRDGALALLKAGNAGIAGAFSTKGVQGGQDPADATPVAKLDTLAKARAIEKNIKYLDAYQQVGDENPVLRDEALTAPAKV